MAKVSFNEATHSYTLDGVSIPSVSSIVKAVAGWRYDAVSPEVLEAARVRGEAIHADIEHGTYGSPEAQWIAQVMDLEQVRFEVMGDGCIDGLAYAGRADMVGTDTIYDIKTGSTKDMLSWTLQLNLYSRMFPGIEYLKVLWTPKKKPAKLVDIRLLDDKKMSQVIAAYRTGTVFGSDFLEEEEMMERAFRMTGTLDQLKALSCFMNNLGIDYERINA